MFNNYNNYNSYYNNNNLFNTLKTNSIYGQNTDLFRTNIGSSLFNSNNLFSSCPTCSKGVNYNRESYSGSFYLY